MENGLREEKSDLEIDGAYRDVLAEIGPEVPKVFLQQAEQAAKIFTMLDAGLINRDSQLLLETISKASFVGTLKARNPEKFPNSFPVWIIEARNRMQEDINLPISEAVIQTYDKWVIENNGVPRSESTDVYVDYSKAGNESVPRSLLSSFKCYLSKTNTPDKIVNILYSLKQQGLHPSTTKLSKDTDQLVLYWATPPNEKLISMLNSLGVNDIGQDSFRIVDNSDKVTVRAAASRNRSLGQGQKVVDFRQDSFDKGKFFRKYLEQCLYWWRNPADPRWMAYVPCEALPENVPDDIRRDAIEMGLEIVYNPTNKFSV